MANIYAEEKPSTKTKYRIEGEFCANCAAKMERALSSTQGIGDTAINFVTKTVYLPPDLSEEAQKIMERIEPGIKLVPVTNREEVQEEEEESWFKGKITRIIGAALLLSVGIIWGSDWHNTQLEVLEYLVYMTAYVLVGYEVLAQALRNMFKGALFDENFLMSIATVGAIAIHQLPEAVGVMLFYSVGEYVEDRAVNRSRRSIKALLDIRPDYANLIHMLEIKKVKPEDVRPGQEILVRPGEKVPLDGVVINGSSFVDTSALTGESVPRKVEKGDTILAGMINQSGVINVRVEKEFAESSVQKILDLVENANTRKAKTEKFITTFSRYYTPAVVLIAALIATIPPIFMGGVFSEWLYRALIILVISCPCALVISVPLGYFGGIGGASRQGILVKGANYLEALTQVKNVVFDKTGTLTKGVFEVQAIKAYENFNEEELLELATIAESHSTHPIAKSITKRYGEEIDTSLLKEVEEIPGKGIQAIIKEKNILLGKATLLQEKGIAIPQLFKESNQVGTEVHLSVDGNYAGVIIISDQVKATAQKTIEELHQFGINTVLLTGDHQLVAQAVATELGVNDFHADLLPQDKVTKLEAITKNTVGKTVFVGDGINDAPVIARADIGVAMGGLGSDAAIEAADVVLMEDKPEKIITALKIARFTKTIIWQNIGFALGIKLFFIFLGILGVANMWEAVFADVGVALLAILNATRIRRMDLGQRDRSFVPLS